MKFLTYTEGLSSLFGSHTYGNNGHDGFPDLIPGCGSRSSLYLDFDHASCISCCVVNFLFL